MVAINAYFDGTAVIPLSTYNFKKNQKVIIFAEDDNKEDFSIKVDKSCIKPAELPKETFADLIGKIELDGNYIKEMREECLL